MARAKRTSDFGTVLLHALLVVSFFVALASGLRIATDDPDLEWLIVLDPALPTEHVFSRHLVSGMGMMAAFAGYLVYVRKAKLQARTRLDRGRIFALLSNGPNRWFALNVIVFRVLMLGLYAVVVSGVALFAGLGGVVMDVHVIATAVAVSSVGLHVLLHLAYGGRNQLLRILRPVPLVMAAEPPDLADLLAQELARKKKENKKQPDNNDEAVAPSTDVISTAVDARATRPLSIVQAHPLSIALVVVIATGMLAVGAEQVTRKTLEVSEIAPELVPRLDGDLSEPVWSRTKAGHVLTTQGGDFGLSHESEVDIRAVHDGIFAYFAIVWDDPTRSLKHMPLIKTGGQWHVLASRPDLADEKTFNEDKFSVLLVNRGLPLIGNAIHLANRPLDDKPPSSTGRGLHYVRNGIADVWLWRASHGGLIGNVDNCHFAGPEQKPNPALGPTAIYSGGFACDPETTIYRSNIAMTSRSSATFGVRPARLPKNIDQTVKALGRVNWRADESDSENARWWMTQRETVPYSSEHDEQLPNGTVIPSIVLSDKLPEATASIRGVARWNAGRWTLEVARRLDTKSPRDVAIKTGTMLWLAAFDHAEKRHTRHLRPFTLRVE